MNRLLQYVDISYEVVEAIDKNIPVVALESTVISHVMPYPQNLETALECEAIIRGLGAVPATLAVIDGRIKIGLSDEEIRFMATQPNVIKMSRRDLPVVVANKLTGATTVATSILIAVMAGIKVLVTGGIGGVHINAQETFDISRDLQEIATNNICVVCSGGKAILDIGLTMEYLETHGVTVLGYQTDEMPAFYSSKSGYRLDYRLDTPEEIGKTIKTKWDLGLDGGVLVANPIPDEYNMDRSDVERAIEKALEDTSLNIKDEHSDETMILDRYLQEESGLGLVANMALLKNNVKLGTLVAKEVYRVDY
ncbi:MAG: pseudouridine-5'-phosphate glycosidase [Tissierellia bacterium]|nr:pseudouridine-5'-phosphate glycosidase [Tissierellia bacterium]